MIGFGLHFPFSVRKENTEEPKDQIRAPISTSKTVSARDSAGVRQTSTQELI